MDIIFERYEIATSRIREIINEDTVSEPFKSFFCKASEFICKIDDLNSIITVSYTHLKEDAAIYVLVLGTFYLLSRKDKKRGLILMVCAAVYFLIAISVVNSYGQMCIRDRVVITRKYV